MVLVRNYIIQNPVAKKSAKVLREEKETDLPTFQLRT